MIISRKTALREILRPWLARLVIGVPTGAALYQFGCDQFDWPKLPALWGMAGSLFPWWGWLLVALAGFVYALFEYVRRNVGGAAATASQEDMSASILPHLAKADEKMAALEGRIGNVEQSATAAAETASVVHRVLFAREMLEIIRPKLETIEKRAAASPPPRQDSGMPIAELTSTKLEHVVVRELEGINAPGLDAFHADCDARIAAIKIDSLLCSMQPGDEEYWNNGTEKQNWHVKRARLVALHHYLRSLLDRYAGDSLLVR